MRQRFENVEERSNSRSDLMTANYVLGIDLGTTNSVIAFCPLGVDDPELQLLPIPQLVDSGTVESRDALPSFLYLGAEHDASGSLDLAWAEGRDFAVGQLARRQAAEVPDRTVGAAKSWLCHSRIDRHQSVLPWGAPDEVPKVSPVTATRRYLEHLVAAWEAAYPDSPVADQQVVLTVPASFDASARELTREAALAAGFPQDFVLLEEPQAAVYSWLANTGDRWRKTMGVGDKTARLRCGGRHNRLDPRWSLPGGGRTDPPTPGSRQPSARRWRQHGPGPRPTMWPSSLPNKA